MLSCRKREAMVMAPPPTHDSGVSPCFHRASFPPQAFPTTISSLRSPQSVPSVSHFCYEGCLWLYWAHPDSPCSSLFCIQLIAILILVVTLILLCYVTYSWVPEVRMWTSLGGPLFCPGEGNGSPLQYSFLGNPMDRGVWWATVHGVTKSQTGLSRHTRKHTGRKIPV